MEVALSPHRHHLVAIPLPGHGHINPMMGLCRRLALQGLLVTVVVTEEWLALLSSPPAPVLHSNIRLRSIPNVLPSEKTRGANYEAFVMAVLTKMGAPVGELVDGLDVAVDAVLADSTLPWAPEIGKRLGVPVSSLFPQSAAIFLALHHLSALEAANGSGTEEESKLLQYLPRSSSSQLADFMATTSTGDSVIKGFTKAISWFPSAHSLLFSSPYELEARAIVALKSKLSPLPIYTIGPSTIHSTPNTTITSALTYFNWLDAQPPSSVLYISLGSFLPISPSQMDEIVAGLCMSNVRFLLVAREDSARVQELSGELGLAVPWTDQPKCLGHPSVGGFLTHCGWNSTLEGVCMGVPMLTFPLMWDQFPNSKLVVDEWKVGLRVKDEDEDGFVGREEIAKVVRKLMDLDGDESRELRRRARELKEMCGLALGEKGSSSDCIDAFVQDIVRREKEKRRVFEDLNGGGI